jgi:hypothetical protein
LCLDELQVLRLKGGPNPKEGIGAKDAVNSLEEKTEVLVVLVCDKQELDGFFLDEKLDHRLKQVSHHRQFQLRDRYIHRELIRL